MAKLIYTSIMSLDGFIADERGNFDWAEPDDEAHSFINDLERPIGTHLYGRRLYEVLVAWEDPQLLADERAVMRDFAAIWQAADKIVFSRTLERVSSARTRIQRDFDAESIRQLKTLADRDLTIGGPGLAGEAIKSGLVDEYQLFIVPIVVGAGKAALPRNVRVPLHLVAERRFESGTVFLHYRAGGDGG